MRPGWRAWAVIIVLAFAGTLIAAWQWVPGFDDAVKREIRAMGVGG